LTTNFLENRDFIFFLSAFLPPGQACLARFPSETFSFLLLSGFDMRCHRDQRPHLSPLFVCKRIPLFFFTTIAPCCPFSLITSISKSLFHYPPPIFIEFLRLLKYLSLLCPQLFFERSNPDWPTLPTTLLLNFQDILFFHPGRFWGVLDGIATHVFPPDFRPHNITFFFSSFSLPQNTSLQVSPLCSTTFSCIPY